MHPTDKRIIRLIEFLVFQQKISSTRHFCQEVHILEQTVSKVKNGTAHFTVMQIENICKKYNVNANWIFGIEKNVFNHDKSIEITDAYKDVLPTI